MNFRTFYDSMEEASKDLEATGQMAELRFAFMRAKTGSEVSDLVAKNIDFMNEYPDTFRMAQRARIRIARIRREKAKSWNLTDKN